ncbi:MAG: ABC transporter ATP-binding protein [Lachnospiraceae bacterium]|nr:ABC transporter ATP-binding protein [Lachnospiraceae bacterium]
MIEIRNLNKDYGSQKALQNVNLTIEQGEIIGLFGENGAGKTTLMKCILDLIGYKGDILLDGEPITRKNIGRISFATCEHSFFPNLTASAHADFYREHFPNFREKRFHGLMDFFQLPENKKLRAFSTGQQNQFEVILALSQGADYILMDEPFAGNDVFNREDFYKVLIGILEPDETILLSTHLIEEVSGFIGRAILIHHGEIVGNAEVSDLEEQGISLMSYIKEIYGYQSNRVSRALADISGKEE